MIIKSISHTSNRASIRNLLAYVFGDNNMVNNKGESITITNLLRGKRTSWAQQFERIERRRTSHYGGREIRYYHEILSFAPESKPTKEELEDLIWKYLELRLDAPTLAFCGVHFSEFHYHAHIVIQGIDAYGKSIRKSKSSFRDNVQIALNTYQQKHHPRLKDSLIDYRRVSKDKIRLESHKAWQRKERTKEPSHKQKLDQIIKSIFIDAQSIEAFLAELSIKNIQSYSRSGKLTGIIYNGRKYRLRKTLGIDFEKLLKPDLKNERLERLRKLSENDNDKNQER